MLIILFLYLCDHLRRDDHKKSGQHDEVRPDLVHSLQKFLIKFLSRGKILRRDALSRHLVLLCPCQGIGIFIVADHPHDLGVGDAPFVHCVQDGLQVCPAAGHENQYS